MFVLFPIWFESFRAMRALPQHLGCGAPGSDCVAKIRTVNFEFKWSATNGLLLTNEVEGQA